MKTPSGNYHLGIVTHDRQLLHAMPHKGVVLSKLHRYRSLIVGYYIHKPGAGEVLPDAAGAGGRIIGGIIVAILAVIAAVYFPPAIGITIAAEAALYGAMAGMVVSLAGNMIVNALCPLPAAETPQLSGLSGDIASSNTYSRYGWGSITNEAQAGLIKPWIFGRIRTAGQVISEKTWYDLYDNEYLDMLICPSGNRITRFDNVLINDTAISYYKGTFIKTRFGDDEQTMIDMFDKVQVQYASGAKVPYDTATDTPVSCLVFASKANITGAKFSIVAPSGLCEFVSNDWVQRTAVFRIQYRKASEQNWHFVKGDGEAAPGSITTTNSDFSGRIVKGFDTNITVTYIAFTLTSYSSSENGLYYCYTAFKVWFRKIGDSSWTLFNTYEFGSTPDNWNGTLAAGSVNIQMGNLPEGYYQVRVDWFNDWATYTEPGYPILWEPYSPETRLQSTFPITNILISSQSDYASIIGDSASPTSLVSRNLQISGLDKDRYYFRIWRTTIDHEETTWRNDLYLKSYAEIIDAQCAYPNHPLLGVRALATDRLSGSRPTVTSVITGAPLSVPPAADRQDTTIDSDEGFVMGTGNTINGVIVDGMHKIKINAALIDPATVPNTIYWLVFLDAPGYAQENRPLTKYYARAETWELTDSGTKTRLYIRMTETVSSGMPVMAFHESVAPTRNTAWAVALMILKGSQGRLTIKEDHWPYWEEWNDWNEELVYNTDLAVYEKRHLYDAVIDFQTDIWTTAFRAAATARATLIASGGSYRPVMDKAATECQVFSEGNAAKFQVNMIPKQDRPNILITTFLDESDNYKQKPISEEDVQGDERPIVKTIPTQVGVCRESQVRRLLRYMLKQNRYITHTLNFDSGLDALECEIGDTFLSQSQAKDLAFSGRVEQVIDNYVVLDRSFFPTAGQVYQLSIWCGMGMKYWQGTLPTTETNRLPVPPGFSMTEPYEFPYVLTRINEERIKYRLLGVRRPTDTMNTELTAIEYRAEVYADD